MKNYFFLLLFTTVCFSQKQEAKLFFLDGTSWMGFGTIDKSDKIAFRLDLADEPTTWDYNEVSGIEFYDDNTVLKYEYVVVPNRKKPRLLEVVVEGSVSLYYYSETIWTPGTPYAFSATAPMAFQGTGATLQEKQQFYLKRKLGAKLTLATLGVFKNWKKEMSAYFHDCDAVIRKIQDNEFGYPQLREMVEFYNDICVGE